MMINGPSLLISFVNVKEWTEDNLINFQNNHHFNFTSFGDTDGHDYIFFRNCKSRYYINNKNAHSYLAMSVIDFDECFKRLNELQDKWRKILLNTSKVGPDIDFLNIISERVKYNIVPTKDCMVPNIGAYNVNFNNIEDVLEYAYLDIFVLRVGRFFYRLRVCKNESCENLFIYKRPKQKYCNDTCRISFNNKLRTEDGRAAEHQRKGRLEKPDIYNR